MRVPLLTPQLIEKHDSLFQTDDLEDSISSCYTCSKGNDLDLLSSNKHQEGERNHKGAPDGEWKGGILSCFQRGIFHPDPWNAFLCPHVLLGQILMRAKLTSLAQPSNCTILAISRCRRWAIRIFFCIATTIVTIASIYCYHHHHYSTTYYRQEQDRNKIKGLLSYHAFDIFWWQELLSIILTLPLSIWALVVMVRLRTAIRERYDIPPTRIPVPPSCENSNSPLYQLSLGKTEDLVCSLCCACCALSQMAHQVSDHEENDSSTTTSCCHDSNSSCCEVPDQKERRNDSKNSNTFWGCWFQKETIQNSPIGSTIEEPPAVVTTTSSLPSNSTTSNNSHLRYRLTSSPLPPS